MKELLFAVVLLGQGASSITGRILSIEGTPAANMRVGAVAVPSAEQGPDTAIVSITQTDSDGRYRLENVPPGRYYVTVGNLDNPTYFPGVPEPAKAAVITVSAGAALSGMDFSMTAQPVRGIQAPPAFPPIPMVLKTIRLVNVTTVPEINDIVTAARAKLGPGRIMSNPQAKAIILREAGDNVAAVERVIADMDRPGAGALSPSLIPDTTAIATDAAGNLTIIEGGSAHRVMTGLQLQLKPATPISVRMNENVRVSFQTLGGMAGLNVILDRDLTPGLPVNFSVDNVGILDALDLLAAQTNTFWHVLSSNTILVSPENVIKRRDYDPQIIKTIYLANATTPQGFNDILTAARTMAGIPYIVANPQANAIVLRDIPNRIALAEKIIADLDGPGNSGRLAAAAPMPLTTVVTYSLSSFNNILVLDAGRALNVTPKRALLHLKLAGPVSLRSTESLRTTYETLAGMAGLNIVFDRDISPLTLNRLAPFKVDDVDLLDALDFLSIQTNNFWEVLDNKTILVAPASTVKHRDHDMQILKTITLANTTTSQGINDIMSALRTLFGLSYIAAYPHASAIVVRDTPARVALAGKIIADLDRSPGSGGPAPASEFLPVTAIGMNSLANISSIFTLDGGRIRNVTPKRARLQLDAAAPISVNINNENARSGFETLARTAGLTVVFDSRMGSGNPRTLNAENIDVLDALDYFSLLTNSFWEVVDNRTILVAPESTVIRRELEPQMTKTFTLTNGPTEQMTNDMMTVARTLLSLSEVKLTATGQIEITASPNRLALAEKIIADLDKPRPGEAPR